MINIKTTIYAESVEEYLEAINSLSGTQKVKIKWKYVAADDEPKVEAGVANPTPVPMASADASQDTAQSSAGTDTPEKTVQAGTGETVTSTASPSDAELDAHGHPWSADLHASTKGKTKEGLWRMGKGQERPAPVEGYPKGGASPEPALDPDGNPPSNEVPQPLQVFDADAGTFTEATEKEADEFAAFTAAAKVDDNLNMNSEVVVQGRVWSDADLSRLANQAATRLNGNIGPLKGAISRYVPAGMTDHSRNVPVEDREMLAQEIEKLADFTFAG